MISDSAVFYTYFGTINLPGIGEVYAAVQGDESLTPHFHLYDHAKRVDYCIGIYDGLPQPDITFPTYIHGELNNDQLKVVDEWKNQPHRPDIGIISPIWKFIALAFDGSFSTGDILENYIDGMETPQYHK